MRNTFTVGHERYEGTLRCFSSIEMPFLPAGILALFIIALDLEKIPKKDASLQENI